MLIQKFNIGDKVKIILEGEYYPKTYTIEKVEYTCHVDYNLTDYYVYKLRGVSCWFREEHLERIEDEKIHKESKE